MGSTLITAYLGQGLAAARPATPALATGTIGYYYATDTGVLTVYANGAWRSIGTPPGTIPTIVQKGFVDNAVSAAVTMGVAPTNGNLLIAMVTGQNNVAGGGWTAVVQDSGGSDFSGIYKKTAGAGESTTQTPITGTGNTACSIFEIAGANATPVVYAKTGVQTSALYSQTQLVAALTNCLALGQLTGDGALATFTSFKNMTQDVTSASVRGIKAGHSDLTISLTAQALAALSGAVQTKGSLVLITS